MLLGDKKVCWYVICTLRRSCISEHLKRLRKYYPDIDVVVVNNSYKQTPFKRKERIIKTNLMPLTHVQNYVSKILLKEYDLLCFSSDDIMILNGGFLEEAYKKFEEGSHFVSFSTWVDPVAYIYDKHFFENVGFNNKLIGKECTDLDLVYRLDKRYGKIDYVGEYWIEKKGGWKSKYVLNPKVARYGKTDVNEQLTEIGIVNGVDRNRTIIKSYIYGEFLERSGRK